MNFIPGAAYAMSDSKSEPPDLDDKEGIKAYAESHGWTEARVANLIKARMQR